MDKFEEDEMVEEEEEKKVLKMGGQFYNGYSLY